MDRTTFWLLVILGLLMPVVVAADAVSQTNHELVANIPFNFTVCKEQMPAGKYKVLPISSTNPRILLLRSEDNRSGEILCTQDIQSSKKTTNGKLIFNRYGDRYFLSELWFQGAKTGSQIVKTDEEQALRKKREKITIKITELKPN